MWLNLGRAEDDWPKEETDYLFELAREYDLRFIVMADRWEYASERSVDVRIPLSCGSRMSG